MIVVSNTSPISNLAVIGRLTLLQQLYSKIIIPTAVYQELLRLARVRDTIEHLVTTAWLEIQPGQNSSLGKTLQHELDEGEAEAIALAISLKADRLLIDERLGRQVAIRYGLKITGLLGILTAAKVEGKITAVKPVLDQLMQQAGFRVSTELYVRTLRAAGESTN